MHEQEPRLNYKTLTKELTLDLVAISQAGATARRSLENASSDQKNVLQLDIEKGQAAEDALLGAHTGLVSYLADKYQKVYGLQLEDLEDLTQEGRFGFIKAIRSFDPEKGMALASWGFINVRGQILRSLRKENGAPPLLSLEATFSEEDDRTLGDILEDRNASSPEEEAYRAQLRIDVAQIIGILTYREQQIVSARIGLLGEPMTLREIGQQWGLSRERVRTIYDKAISQLPYRFRGYKANL